MGNTEHKRLCSFSVFVAGGLRRRRRRRRRLALRRSRVQWILRVLILLRAPAFDSLNLQGWGDRAHVMKCFNVFDVCIPGARTVEVVGLTFSQCMLKCTIKVTLDIIHHYVYEVKPIYISKLHKSVFLYFTIVVLHGSKRTDW